MTGRGAFFETVSLFGREPATFAAAAEALIVVFTAFVFASAFADALTLAGRSDTFLFAIIFFVVIAFFLLAHGNTAHHFH